MNFDEARQKAIENFNLDDELKNNKTWTVPEQNDVFFRVICDKENLVLLIQSILKDNIIIGVHNGVGKNCVFKDVFVLNCAKKGA